MSVLKVDSVNMGGNIISQLIYLSDGSVISIGEGNCFSWTSDEWNNPKNGMKWFFCQENENERFTDSETEQAWYEENAKLWEASSYFEFPDVWNSGNRFVKTRTISREDFADMYDIFPYRSVEDDPLDSDDGLVTEAIENYARLYLGFIRWDEGHENITVEDND